LALSGEMVPLIFQIINMFNLWNYPRSQQY
jgi:hypothetical protein